MPTAQTSRPPAIAVRSPTRPTVAVERIDSAPNTAAKGTSSRPTVTIDSVLHLLQPRREEEQHPGEDQYAVNRVIEPADTAARGGCARRTTARPSAAREHERDEQADPDAEAPEHLQREPPPLGTLDHAEEEHPRDRTPTAGRRSRRGGELLPSATRDRREPDGHAGCDDRHVHEEDGAPQSWSSRIPPTTGPNSGPAAPALRTPRWPVRAPRAGTASR